MEQRQIFVRLLLGAFGLMMVAFMIRGTSSLFLGSERATMIAGPLFLLALGCAVAGFFLAVGLKVRDVLASA